MANSNPASVMLLSSVQSALAGWPAPVSKGDCIAVPTHCLRADGAVIRVIIKGGENSFIVHDDGGAMDELADVGGHIPEAITLLRRQFSDQGFRISEAGAITSPAVPLSDLAPTIALIANASKEAGEFLLGRWRPVVARNFRAVLRKLLEAEFPHVSTGFTVAGASTKQHKFDFAIERDGGSVIVLDAVFNDANSIRSAIVRGIDVAKAEAPNVKLRLVYDDDADWSAEDLNLLQLGGSVIAASKAPQILHALAA